MSAAGEATALSSRLTWDLLPTPNETQHRHFNRRLTEYAMLLLLALLLFGLFAVVFARAIYIFYFVTCQTFEFEF